MEIIFILIGIPLFMILLCIILGYEDTGYDPDEFNGTRF